MGDRQGVFDWIKLNCGDRVREHDGRHIGRVEAIDQTMLVKVKWLDTGWISWLHRDTLYRLSKFDEERHG